MNTLMKNRSITERNTSMNSLYLSDIMRRVNLVPDKVKLIRQIYDEEFAEYYESGHMKDYFSIMSSNFSEDYDYWLVFLAEDKGYATFLMCYKVGEAVKATRNQCPRSFLHPEVFNGRHKYFKLKETDIMDDLTERLIIDWGSGKRSWHQKGTIEKRVVAIKTDSKPFPGFLDIFVTYEELREIINEPIRYSNCLKMVLGDTPLRGLEKISLCADANGEIFIRGWELLPAADRRKAVWSVPLVEISYVPGRKIS